MNRRKGRKDCPHSRLKGLLHTPSAVRYTALSGGQMMSRSEAADFTGQLWKSLVSLREIPDNRESPVAALEPRLQCCYDDCDKRQVLFQSGGNNVEEENSFLSSPSTILFSKFQSYHCAELKEDCVWPLRSTLGIVCPGQALKAEEVKRNSWSLRKNWRVEEESVADLLLSLIFRVHGGLPTPRINILSPPQIRFAMYVKLGKACGLATRCCLTLTPHPAPTPTRAKEKQEEERNERETRNTTVGGVGYCVSEQLATTVDSLDRRSLSYASAMGSRSIGYQDTLPGAPEERKLSCTEHSWAVGNQHPHSLLLSESRRETCSVYFEDNELISGGWMDTDWFDERASFLQRKGESFMDPDKRCYRDPDKRCYRALSSDLRVLWAGERMNLQISVGNHRAAAAVSLWDTPYPPSLEAAVEDQVQPAFRSLLLAPGRNVDGANSVHERSGISEHALVEPTEDGRGLFCC
ncbi:unnamed protein product [Cyprideis torosa]|uniref:Uncharacterized protein n=1 Tax=Cyprideis torosa TaxID=163714 RepID=A0A7R8WGY4_9CRUS|nr:unnamed protein product [Cyprideis torosa]CAG0892264.1 unnamed protein product [Cyprideis torosa]